MQFAQTEWEQADRSSQLAKLHSFVQRVGYDAAAQQISIRFHEPAPSELEIRGISVNSGNEIRYALDFGLQPRRKSNPAVRSTPAEPATIEPVLPGIPRIAKLMALAIRFEALVSAGTVLQLR